MTITNTLDWVNDCMKELRSRNDRIEIFTANTNDWLTVVSFNYDKLNGAYALEFHIRDKAPIIMLCETLEVCVEALHRRSECMDETDVKLMHDCFYKKVTHYIHGTEGAAKIFGHCFGVHEDCKLFQTISGAWIIIDTNTCLMRRENTLDKLLGHTGIHLDAFIIARDAGLLPEPQYVVFW